MDNRPQHERGDTLVELLISLAIIGVTVVSVLSAVGTGIITAGFHRQQATGSSAVRDVAEAVQAAPYSACATTYVPSPKPSLAGVTYTITVPKVLAYPSPAPVPSGSAAPLPAPTWLNQSQCTSATATPTPYTNDLGAQQVTIVVTPVDSRSRPETVTIVKRQPCPSPATVSVPAC